MATAPTLPDRLYEWYHRGSADLALGYRDEVHTYADLLGASETRAAALHGLGVTPGTHVGLLKPNRPDWLACAFAVWRLGAVLVPLNTLYRRNELAHALRLADVELLIADGAFLRNHYRTDLEELCPRLIDSAKSTAGEDRLPSLRTALFSGDPTLPAVRNWDTQVVNATATAPTPPVEIDPSADAAIFFTSGSTAAPKGVVHTHASMLQAADNVGERLGLDRTDRTYGYLPLFFNGGLVGVALATLGRGGAVLLQDIFSAAEAIKLMQRHQCSVFFGWPHQAEAIAQSPSFDRDQLHLRKGPGANAPWASAILADDHSCVGTWGMSETGPMATCSSHRDPIKVRQASHGRPMPGLDLRIVDDAGIPLPAGSAGEILVRGNSLMRAYYGQTAEATFDAAGYFHTGDRGQLAADGSLSFLGRIRDVIKTAGVNVAAADVEQTLLQHPDVESAYVVPVAHATRGENIAAFVVTRSRAGELDAILDHCREQLAAYKVPRHIFRVSDADLPVLGSGKVDRTRLRAIAAERAAR